MKKIVLSSVAALALFAASPAFAASTLAVAGGSSNSNTLTGAAVVTHGLAVGAAGAAAVNTSIGTGVAVSTPVGGISAGIGQSQGLAGSAAGSLAGFGGSAATISGAHSSGNGNGFGFTNSRP